MEYRTRIHASIESIRYLLIQGLTFRGHDESCKARNQDVGDLLTAEGKDEGFLYLIY